MSALFLIAPSVRTGQAVPIPAPPHVDPLPSWERGQARQAIIAFISAATRPGAGFIPVEERVAVFDNDGTLWTEQPLYFQMTFAIERIRQMVAADPSLRNKPAFATIADKDAAGLSELTEAEITAAALAVQEGLTAEEYQQIAWNWLKTARHPRFKRAFTSLVYQPQLELLNYLRANGFKTYIVSGGEVQFMRTFAQDGYGIPPEQVIGTTQNATFETRTDRSVVVAQSGMRSLDDGPGKPVHIALHIGRRPVIAVGNSDGDLQMLQYSSTPERKGLQILIHHDDAVREYAYDRQSKVGRLDKALDEASRSDWVVVSMKADWRVVYPPAPVKNQPE
ncbi:HAD family hydrolase [Asticcacaulis sp. ZE23SCel15]|uniref:HAD family hydrolase n=1 Tax=Asticcacaulis sp. ZE23SCel15 TaxID=3059027 RepID=UPI0026604A9C|nr:HAD family hydrolase [Asticcacaulis sp. ZE23SCel15]WKL57637.1 HAD family hydrolase [Asticcacaulis sp. ZE23SCel15]